METRSVTYHFLKTVQLISQSFYKDTPPLAIDLAHPAQVAGEVPLADEVCQHRLVELRRTQIHRNPPRAKLRD